MASWQWRCGRSVAAAATTNDIYYTHNFTHPTLVAESRDGWSYDIAYHGVGALASILK
jgi:hypothetical protein